MTLYPSCATPAQIKAITGNLPLVGAVPPCTSYIYVQQNDGLLNLDAQGIDTDFEYIMPTDSWGTFSIGDAISKFTHYVQSNGPDGVPFSVLNKSGAHGSIAFQMRGNLGWSYEDFGAQMFMNYTGGYQNWNSPDNAVILNAALNPSGGGDRVSPNTTFDLNLTYDFEDGYVGMTQFSLTFRNLFDKQAALRPRPTGTTPPSLRRSAAWSPSASPRSSRRLTGAARSRPRGSLLYRIRCDQGVNDEISNMISRRGIIQSAGLVSAATMLDSMPGFAAPKGGGRAPWR